MLFRINIGIKKGKTRSHGDHTGNRVRSVVSSTPDSEDPR